MEVAVLPPGAHRVQQKAAVRELSGQHHKRVMSASARRKIAEAQRARWAKWKRVQKAKAKKRKPYKQVQVKAKSNRKAKSTFKGKRSYNGNHWMQTPEGKKKWALIVAARQAKRQANQPAQAAA